MSKPQDEPFYQIKAATDTSPPEIVIYGEILSYTPWLFDDGRGAKDFSDELTKLGDVDKLTVRINSGGGDVFAAHAIYSRLKSHKAHVTIKIDGLAASAATIIAMAGDTIEIPASGFFMIHEARLGLYDYYSADDIKKAAAELETVNHAMSECYAARTGKGKDEIAALMAAEKWFTGAEAVENGFCDSLMFGAVNATAAVAAISDPTHYKNLPEAIAKALTKSPEIERKNEEDNTMEIKNLDDLKAAYPDLVTQIAASAANTERERIKAIEGVALPGYEELAAAAKFDGKTTAGDLAAQIITAEKKRGTDYITKRDADAQNSGANNIGTTPEETGAKPDEYAEVTAALDRVMPKK